MKPNLNTLVILPFIFFLIFLFSIQKSKAQENSDKLRIMFYNVENLFDPFHDTLKNDYEYVGGGIRGWSWKRFDQKLKNISKVIINAGGWQPPELVGFSEVENRFVLIQLLKRTPLERFGYKIIHEESPDERGIDVALIYQRDKFKEISHKAISVHLTDSIKTRNILYVKGICLSGVNSENDTLHLFINHWPSRTGGPALTMQRRKEAALTLKPAIDSILLKNSRAQIVIMGDFNDEATDESLTIHLGVHNILSDTGFNLYNLMFPLLGKWDTGTNKFKNQWGLIDQFIVSESLIRDEDKVKFTIENTEILAFPFLLKNDEKYTGTVPFRTYNGMKYQGGYSDHLPVMLTLKINY